MVVQVVGEYLFAGVQMKFRMQRMLIRLTLFEQFHAIRLLNPTLQDASHAFYGRLTQLIGLATVVVDASVQKCR